MNHETGGKMNVGYALHTYIHTLTYKFNYF